MIDAAKAMIPPEQEKDTNPSPALIKQMEKREEIIKEATSLLKRLADRGFPDAQYFWPTVMQMGLVRRGASKTLIGHSRSLSLLPNTATRMLATELEHVVSMDGDVGGIVQRPFPFTSASFCSSP